MQLSRMPSENDAAWMKEKRASFVRVRTLYAGSRVQTVSIPLSVRTLHVADVERRCGRSENVNQTTRETELHDSSSTGTPSLTHCNADRRFADSAVQNFFPFILR